MRFGVGVNVDILLRELSLIREKYVCCDAKLKQILVPFILLIADDSAKIKAIPTALVESAVFSTTQLVSLTGEFSSIQVKHASQCFTCFDAGYGYLADN